MPTVLYIGGVPVRAFMVGGRWEVIVGEEGHGRKVFSGEVRDTLEAVMVAKVRPYLLRTLGGSHVPQSVA